MASLLSKDVPIGFCVCAILLIFIVLYRVMGGLGIVVVRYPIVL